MKQYEVVLSRALLFVAILLIPSLATAAPCQPFTYLDWWGPVPMTAAIVNPVGPVTGDVDATGCDVGVFFGASGTKGLVQNAKIHGASRAGVLVGGTGLSLTVDITNSSIYDIGAARTLEWPMQFNGSAIAFITDFSRVSGKITGNVLSRYGYVGIFTDGADLQITDNIISGQRSGWYSANYGQTGILCWVPAKLTIERNLIIDHVYAGPHEWWRSYGIQGVPLPGSKIRQNTLLNNQWGIFLDMYWLSVPTSITVVDNRIFADDLYSPGIWQVGIYIVGSRDKIEGNVISGYGYDAANPSGMTTPLAIGETDPRGRPK